ncbi:MAG: hypothetical protein JEY94_17075 [Melioribacteraceae bacterium]|nr:hypothetical protein [Melioribacteraceae bacterium]
MKGILGIRREDKNKWEKRVPLTPANINKLKNNYDIETHIQPFPERAFKDSDYKNSGAVLTEDLSACSTIIAVKEVPKKLIFPNKKYLFFSHTIKGQSYNMPLLKDIMSKKCTLVDYECIKNDSGRRLVFFGRFAGISGMIETLHGIGKRYSALGIETPFVKIKSAYQYGILSEAIKHITEVAENIKLNGLRSEIAPLVIGITGYGNVSNGAQEIFDILPHEVIEPKDLLTKELDKSKIYKVVFKEADLFETVNVTDEFELLDYFKNPKKYKSKFFKYVNKVDVLINAIYWDTPYPKLLEKKYLKENSENIKLKITTDISCDIDGSIEFTSKVMEPDLPAYLYNPKDESLTDGFEGEGILNIVVDNLPTELPKDASEAFGEKLFPFIENFVKTDISVPFEEVKFVDEIKNAVIVYNGELTPRFKYLEEFLK